jgi:recombination protein RecA
MGKGLEDLANILTKQEEDKPVENIPAKPTKELFTKADKFAALRSVEKALNKQLDTTMSIVRLGDRVGIPIPSISTGLPSLDYDVLGCGGVPRGRIIEIYGPESSGKTTLCLHLIAQEQKNTENICAIIDVEHALDASYAASLGVNVDELVVSQPSSGEDALEIAESLIDSGCVSLIIIDSVAALVPRAELDGEMGDASMGLQARLMSQACRKLVGKVSSKKVSVVFVNQLRDKIGVMYGSPETTTGGKALKFYASVRLDVRRREVIGPKDKPVGHQLRVKAVKNKCGVPLRETTINLLYGTGIDTFSDFIAYAVKLGVIEQKGAWFYFEKENVAQGLTALVDRARLDTVMYEKIKAGVDKKREEDGKTKET